METIIVCIAGIILSVLWIIEKGKRKTAERIANDYAFRLSELDVILEETRNVLRERLTEKVKIIQAYRKGKSEELIAVEMELASIKRELKASRQTAEMHRNRVQHLSEELNISEAKLKDFGLKPYLSDYPPGTPEGVKIKDMYGPDNID